MNASAELCEATSARAGQSRYRLLYDSSRLLVRIRRFSIKQ